MGRGRTYDVGGRGFRALVLWVDARAFEAAVGVVLADGQQCEEQWEGGRTR